MHLNSSVTDCSFAQTGHTFPMKYSFSDCGKGSCNITKTTFTSTTWTCTNSENYINYPQVKELTEVFKQVMGSNATYDWCSGFIYDDGLSVGAIIGIAVGVLVVIAGVIGVIIYCRRKKRPQDGYQEFQK